MTKTRKRVKSDWKRAFADKVIGEMLEYRSSENLCEEEDCIGERCPTCDAMRKAVDACEGIVRANIY